jgi:Ca2+-transporting ATPase
MAIRRPNPALAWIFAAVAVILALGLLEPSVRSLFSFGPLHGDDIGLALAAATTALIVLELAKSIWRDRLGF